MRSQKSIEQLTLDGKLVKKYKSAREASRELGISYKVISKCCNGNAKSYKGFRWQFTPVQSASTIETTSFKDGRK